MASSSTRPCLAAEKRAPTLFSSMVAVVGVVVEKAGVLSVLGWGSGAGAATAATGAASPDAAAAATSVTAPTCYLNTDCRRAHAPLGACLPPSKKEDLECGVPHRRISGQEKTALSAPPRQSPLRAHVAAAPKSALLPLERVVRGCPRRVESPPTRK